MFKDLVIEKQNPLVDEWIKEQATLIKNKYVSIAWQDLPVFKGYVELHKRHGAGAGYG